MSTPTYRLGDYGQTIRRTILDQDNMVQDVSGASTKSLLLADPSGNVSTLALSFTTDGTDGQVEYVIATGVLDEAGTWTMQLKLTDGATFVIYTEQESFMVEGVLA